MRGSSWEEIEVPGVARTDERWRGLCRGLDQLDNEGLHNIIDCVENGGRVVLDELNYDERTGLWCPLALGLDVPGWLQEWEPTLRITNRVGKQVLLEVGRARLGEFNLNPMRGCKGTFFRENRQRDTVMACQAILLHRTTTG